MPTSPRADVVPDRRPGEVVRARLAAGGVAAFWTGTLVAGALAPGYSARDDYVSSLAGRGSQVAVLGIAALAVLGLAHLVAASALRGGVRLPLALAGVAGLTAAAFRTACPQGAAGCGFGANDTVADLADLVHGYAVLGYEVALLAAMAVVASGLARPRPVAAALTVAVAVVSVVLALQIGGADNGWWQRAWLLVNTAWLVLVTASGRTGRRWSPREPAPAGRSPRPSPHRIRRRSR